MLWHCCHFPFMPQLTGRALFPRWPVGYGPQAAGPTGQREPGRRPMLDQPELREAGPQRAAGPSPQGQHDINQMGGGVAIVISHQAMGL